MAGGDPDRLTLRRFFQVAYAILVEEYQRLGIDLLSAIEKVGQLGRGTAEEQQTDDLAVQNQRSMEQLMTMMGGVKGSPV